MECSELVNTIGLFSDIIGFLFLWKYGLSRDPEVGDSWGKDPIIENKYKTRSSIGVVLVILGFVLQILSNFIT